MRDVVLIADSGPLIALSLISKVVILRSLYREVCVPSAVADEIAGQGEFRQGADLFIKESWIKVMAVPSPYLTLLPVFLGKGEVEVIQLGSVRSGSLLLIDDYRARRAAEALQMTATGTAGVLVRAKECGLIPAVVPLLREMRDCGYYISETVVEMARIRAGE